MKAISRAMQIPQKVRAKNHALWNAFSIYVSENAICRASSLSCIRQRSRTSLLTFISWKQILHTSLDMSSIAIWRRKKYRAGNMIASSHVHHLVKRETWWKSFPRISSHLRNISWCLYSSICSLRINACSSLQKSDFTKCRAR